MSKVRVYEVARELGLNNRDLLSRIQSLGIQVRNHMSALDPAEVDRVRRALEKDRADNTVEERIRKTVIRRRTVSRKKKPVEEEVAAKENGGSATGSVGGLARPLAIVAAPTVEGRVSAVAPSPTPKAAPAKKAAEPAVAKTEAIMPPPPAEPVPEPVIAEPAPPEPPAVAQPAPEQPAAAEPAAAAVTERRPSQPPSVKDRLGHANLPPGVVSRGNQTAPAAGQISDAARARIVSQHAQSRGPRRREVGRRELGQPGRPTGGRHGRRRVSPNRGKGQKTEITVPSAQKRKIKIEDNINLSTLAQRMSLKATDLLMKLMQLGMMNVTINSTLDSDTAQLIATEFNYEVENVAKSEDELIDEMRGAFEDDVSDHQSRAPIITVMGHVDHGKTSLLDKIRSANVAAGEAGGITQHISAFRVDTKKGAIVFLDTPGHEAFTAMRSRGAQATDLVVLVVAADDGVMPQTKEAINHAKAAEVPILVAVNKIDLPDAQPQNIRNELVGYGLQPEEWGGTTLFCDVSAITGEGVDSLLDSIALQSEMLELSANSKIPAEGIVLEAYLDRGRGPVANVLVRNGTLTQGDTVVAGAAIGKVRALNDEDGKRLQTAGPATPVEVLGLSEVPAAGDMLYVVENEDRARALVEQRQREAAFKQKAAQKTGLDAFKDAMARGERVDLNVVIKSDVHGSLEALTKALTDLSTEKVSVEVIHTGVGGITENDVMLASASKALIIGFNVRPAGKAGATAKSENVEIRSYKVIYEAVDDVKKAMAGLLAPEFQEKELGKAEVRTTFGIPKIGTIGGCYVTDGKIVRNAKLRLVRDSAVVWEGEVGSLRRFKEDVKEVTKDFECGIGLQGYNDLKDGDIIECYELEEIEATL